MTKKTAILFTLALITFFFSLKMGTIAVSWSELWNFLTSAALPSEVSTALGHIRFPRVGAAFFVGASLAVSGMVLQSLLRNPLADSYTLGISGGSAVGASLAMHLSFLPSYVSIPGLSFAGSLFAVVFVLVLASRTLKYESRTLILVGLMTSLFLGALSVFTISILPVEKNQSALTWLMGEFGSSRDFWTPSFSLIAVLPLLYIYRKSKTLDVLTLGDTKAVSLGYSPRLEKTVLILLVTLLTSMAISISGLIGFIGLVSPHLARKYLRTSLHQKIFPAALLIGGTILMAADTLGRTLIADREIPAGSLSAVIGAPILIFLLLEKSYAQGE